MSPTRTPVSDSLAATGRGQGVAVTLSDLHRSYGSIRALDGLTLDIARVTGSLK